MTDHQPSRLPPLSERQAGVQPSPCDVFLTAGQVIARYGWGRTKGYRILRENGFPRPIGGDRYRLDALIAWEESQLVQPRPSKAAPSLPARKRARVST
jgi:predicted DNA-binding transcriptional regulator AlpA